MSIFSRLFGLKKARDEDPEAFARKIYEAAASSQGKLMPPDLGITIQKKEGTLVLN